MHDSQRQVCVISIESMRMHFFLWQKAVGPFKLEYSIYFVPTCPSSNSFSTWRLRILVFGYAGFTFDISTQYFSYFSILSYYGI